MLDINESERICEYHGETYYVRDNGSIFRCQKPNKRKRQLDEKWTFGNPCSQKGYMNFSSETVHRIVATAFLEKQPSEKHIVDHIDTNKKNNRAENLRCITRLENILLNPITLSRIIFKYGSIDNFLSNPFKPLDGALEQNFDWMRTVSKEESDSTRNNLINWAKEGEVPTGGQLGEWIFNQGIVQPPSTRQPNYIMSKTPNAVQRIIFFNDKPNEYPSTPEATNGNPLKIYNESLKEGATFFRNHNGKYVVVKSGFSKDGQSIYVMTRAAYVWTEQEDGEHVPVPITELQEKVSIKDLPHALTEIIYEDDLYVHSKVESGFHPIEMLEKIFEDYTQKG